MSDETPATLYLETISPGALVDFSPLYGAVEMDSQEVARIKRLSELVETNGLLECRAEGVVDWSQENDPHLQAEQLAVTEQVFWYAGYEKHTGATIETEMVPINELDNLTPDNQGRMFTEEGKCGGFRESVIEQLEEAQTKPAGPTLG